MSKDRACANNPALSNTDAHDQLMIAISILQAQHMAADSNLLPHQIYGTSYMPDEALEHAIKILIGLLPFVDFASGNRE